MNKTFDITENEYRLLVAVESGRNHSQRKLAGKLNLSLGMINICLHRLARKGYIKIHGLNARKVKYMLTPKGFAEKMRKSYAYTQKTINELAKIKASIKSEIERNISLGRKEFVISGFGELSDIAELATRDLKRKAKFRRVSSGDDFIITGSEKISILEIITQGKI